MRLIENADDPQQHRLAEKGGTGAHIEFSAIEIHSSEFIVVEIDDLTVGAALSGAASQGNAPPRKLTFSRLGFP